MKLEIRRHDDLGSNLMEARIEEDGPINGFMDQLFLGYESQVRRPFTLKDVQDFVMGLFAHKKFKPHAKIVLDIFGTTDFSGVTVAERVSPADHSKTKKKHLKADRDSRGNRYGGGRR